jgi:hypothetical protein
MDSVQRLRQLCAGKYRTSRTKHHKFSSVHKNPPLFALFFNATGHAAQEGLSPLKP